MAAAIGGRFLVVVALCGATAAAAAAGTGEQQVVAADGAAGDRFGAAIDVDGATFVVGADAHDEGGADAGTAYVFVRCRGFLVPQAELRPSDPAAGARFGRAVAAHDDVIVVGAPEAPGGGAAYVFTRTRGVWAQVQKLTPSDAAAGDLFGAALEIDGTRIAVGAPGRDAGTGRVFVFSHVGGTWTETAALRPAGVEPGGTAEGLGSAVALRGSTLAATASGTGSTWVGSVDGAAWTVEAVVVVAPGAGAALPYSLALDGGDGGDGDLLAIGAAGDDAGGTNAGSVTLRTRGDGTWPQVATLSAQPSADGGAFGGSVALAGGVLVVGAAGESTGGAGAGGVHVFSRRASGWTFDRRVAAPGAAAGDAFGTAVALAPDGAVAGAPGRGAGFVLAHDALPSQKLVHASPLGGDGCGRSAAMDGETALVGVPGDDDLGADSGSVLVFVRSGFTWSLQTTLTAEDGAAGDAFGSAIAIFGDTALVGAKGADTEAADAGAAYVFVRSGTTWTQQTKLAAADGAAGALLGGSVALSGDTAIVGAGADDDKGAGSGSAYVFLRTGTSWSQQVKLVAGDGAAGDSFGTSVALDLDTAVVGATGDDDKGADSGSAYVFVRAGTAWTQQSKLLAPDGAADDGFGGAVAVSGDTALVAAPLDDTRGPTVVDSGSVQEFVRSAGNWTWRSELSAVDRGTGDFFGTRLSMSGDAVLVGSPMDNVGALTDSGSAYVFVRSGTGWTQLTTKFTAADAASGDTFGRAVALSGRTALIGADGDDLPPADSGSAWIRAIDLPSWNARAKITASDAAESAEFGSSVAISGGTAIVGARLEGPTGARQRGSAYVFERTGDAWGERARLEAPDSVTGENFGASAGIDADVAVVGAPFRRVSGVQQGGAEVFVRAGNAWAHQAALRAEDGAQGDELGGSVGVSGDTAIVGAARDDDLGADSGSAYVFTRTGTAWAQSAKLVPADLAAGYRFGTAVAIDGDVAAVGAPFDDDRGADSGSVYVFVRTGGVWAQHAKLTAADGAAGDEFGESVAVSGDSILVGARASDVSGVGNAGAGYVFVRSGGTWTQQARLVASDPAGGANVGRAVAVSGDSALLGARASGTNPVDAVYVFVRSTGGWTQVAKLSEAGGSVEELFGAAVALSGETALIGAKSDSDRAERAGAAHFFDAVPDPVPLAASAAVPAEWTEGVPWDIRLRASGGDAPRQWRVAGGALPAGAGVDSPGARIIGAPAEGGDFAFTIECSDACVRTATFDGAVHVNAAPEVVPGPLPPAAVGRAYEAPALARTGGTGAFTWTLVDGGGSGLVLDPESGILSGVLDAAGAATLRVSGFDSLGAATTEQTFEIVAGTRVDLAARGPARETLPQTPDPVHRAVDALAGSTLDVTVKPPKGSLPPTFLLVDPSGEPVDVSGALKTSKRKAQLRRLPLPATGRYALVIRPDPAGPAGTMSVTLAVRAGVTLRRPVTLADGAPAEVAIAALPGSLVTCKVAAARKQTVAPRVVSLTGPSGAAVPFGPAVEKSRTTSFSYTETVGGESRLVLGTRDGTSGDAVVTVRIRAPKGYGYTVPDPP